MTKAQLKTALEAKFDKVGDWEGGFAQLLGLNRYDIKVFNYGESVRAYTVYVEDEGTVDESAFFMGSDPTIDPPAPVVDFRSKVLAEIQARVDAEQIAGGLITSIGDKVAEVNVYTLSGADVAKDSYVIYEKPDTTLGFRKIV